MTRKSVDFRLGNDVRHCGNCQNWGIDEECSVLKQKTPRSGLCAAFVGLEEDQGAPASLGAGMMNVPQFMSE